MFNLEEQEKNKLLKNKNKYEKKKYFFEEENSDNEIHYIKKNLRKKHEKIENLKNSDLKIFIDNNEYK